jgi:hypothetical protein
MLLSAVSFNNENSNVHFIDLESYKEECSVVISSTKINDIEFHPRKPAIMAMTENALIVAGWDPSGVYGKYLI